MNGIRKDDGTVDGTRITMLVAASIGLGLLVDKVFFLIGGAIVVGALAAAATHGISEHAPKLRMAHHRH
jgi:hypothetical protein